VATRISGGEFAPVVELKPGEAFMGCYASQKEVTVPGNKKPSPLGSFSVLHEGEASERGVWFGKALADTEFKPNESYLLHYLETRAVKGKKRTFNAYDVFHLTDAEVKAVIKAGLVNSDGVGDGKAIRKALKID
jgi:hypothetical protein